MNSVIMNELFKDLRFPKGVPLVLTTQPACNQRGSYELKGI